MQITALNTFPTPTSHPMKHRPIRIKSCLSLLAAFYAGFYVGNQYALSQSPRYLMSTSLPYDMIHHLPFALNTTNEDDDGMETLESSSTKLYTEQEVQAMIKRRLELFSKLRNKGETRSSIATEQSEQSTSTRNLPLTKEAHSSSWKDQSSLFPRETKSFVSAMSLVDRDEFARLFDAGVPLDYSSKTNSKVLLLHGKQAWPPQRNASSMIPVIENVQDAVKNCNYVNVVLTQPNRKNQCIAIMGQYNSYHIHRFMRGGEPKTTAQQRRGVVAPIDPTAPLELVRRGADPVFSFTTKTPTVHETRRYWNQTLQQYLTNLDVYLKELEPLVKKAALCKAVIVMTCNLGQAPLLANLVCSARARGLDLSGVIVFATDAETASYAEGLGLAAYYNEKLFKHVPRQHASSFGDSVYADTIISKVFCVQLVSMLGYDVLFADVDMVWYHDPLQNFQNMTFKHDIYLSHDGSRAEFYAPYSGNTGFYYVRNNARSQYFINHLLVSGDLIASTKTHQAPFLSLMSDHASLHGLRVKILPSDSYPGGMHFHYHPSFMNALLNPQAKRSRTIDPVIFHMSWSDNKERKVEFFQQMGEWYVKDKCFKDGTQVGQDADAKVDGDKLASMCCSAEPIIACHYSDRPSKVPCPNSPKFGEGSTSW
ncbi:Nucleotide-diphospho-sugar transferase [Seminavis robusta]|uniref:Nucleotide-diphospho-sugar transferase n=1 Tax=Seminavis robusta TaxID=568900 RepID=A0A9N8ENP3_9STRA|nr:Nucleotide-diphospho-sugar transferase [Seminavis robusta]|eukprot:Sro1296_g260330.1 Nucleotide-diphospho-sugar transferase (652) ;mRNA; f:3799-5988